MNKSLYLLMSFMIAVPLALAAAEPRVPVPGAIIPRDFNPLIFPDGGNQWITDSYKWNIEQVRARLTAWSNDAVGQMNDHQKERFANLLAKINEISDWLRDKTPEQRARWQVEFANKVRELKALFSIGFMHNLSQAQQREFNLLKGHVGQLAGGAAFHHESIEQIRELLHIHRTFI